MAGDLEQTRLGYFNSGIALANQFGEGMELGLRKQQLKSQEAARRIQERKLTADLGMIELEKQKLSAEIAQRAAQDAEWLQVDTRIKQEQAAFNAGQSAGLQGPEPDWLSRGTQIAQQVAPMNPKTLAATKLQGDLQAQRALAEQRSTSPLEAEALEALISQRNAAASASKAKEKAVASGQSFTKPELEKIFSAAEADGTPFTPEQKRQAREVHLGLRAKEGTEPAVPSEGTWIARNFQDFMATRPRRTVNGKSEYLSDDQAVEVLRDRYHKIMRGGGRSEASAPTSPSPAAPQRIQVKDSSGKVVGTIPDTPSQRKLATDKGLTPVQ
jgi:hypothetical protein